MKEKMLEFILKRLGTKVDDLRNTVDLEQAGELIADDMDVYLETLKDILAGVILP